VRGDIRAFSKNPVGVKQQITELIEDKNYPHLTKAQTEAAEKKLSTSSVTPSFVYGGLRAEERKGNGRELISAECMGILRRFSRISGGYT